MKLVSCTATNPVVWWVLGAGIALGLVFVGCSTAHGQTPVLVEDFDSIGGLVDNGWTLRNNSSLQNIIPSWFRGPLLGPEYAFFWPRFSPVFNAHQGDHYLAANFRTCGGWSGTGTLSLWAVTPPFQFHGKTVSFWARRTSEPFFPDRLQVRLGFGANADPGVTAEGIGDFGIVLLDVPNLPSEWTLYTLPIELTDKTVKDIGRIAFRYYSPDAGPEGVNSDYIGIDTLRIY